MATGDPWVFQKQREQVNPIMTMSPANDITMLAGGTEMLKIGPDGFYVRGVKVPVDDNEALAVYHGFQQWLSWHHLTRE
jgi:hypothetical protein